jgi:hypothetical protein
MSGRGGSCGGEGCKVSLSLLTTISENGNTIRDAADCELGEFMDTILLEFPEDDIGLFDQPFVLFVLGLPGIEDENHACIKGLLAHGPGNKNGGVPSFEEEKGVKQGNTGVDHKSSSAERSWMRWLFCVVIQIRVRHCLLRSWRRSHVGRGRMVAGHALRAFDTLAVEEYQEGLNFCEEG